MIVFAEFTIVTYLNLWGKLLIVVTFPCGQNAVSSEKAIVSNRYMFASNNFLRIMAKKTFLFFERLGETFTVNDVDDVVNRFYHNLFVTNDCVIAI